MVTLNLNDGVVIAASVLLFGASVLFLISWWIRGTKQETIVETKAKQKKEEEKIKEAKLKAFKKELDAELKANKQAIQYAKPYNPLKTNKSKRSFRYWKDWFIDKYRTNKMLLVNMELYNGFHKQFLVVEKEGSFEYAGGRYIIDNECKYYLLDAKMYAADYHEGYTNPIHRKIPVGDIRDTVEAVDSNQVEYATNPKTLERFITARVAEGIMKGQALDDFMRQVRLLLIITLILSAGTLAYLLVKTGAFQQIQGTIS